MLTAPVPRAVSAIDGTRQPLPRPYPPPGRPLVLGARTPRDGGGSLFSAPSPRKGLEPHPPKDVADSLVRHVESTVGTAFNRPYHAAYDKARRRKDLLLLQELFTEVDVDKSGQVAYEEFAKCMQNPTIYEVMHRRFGFQRHEVPRIFRALDVDCSGHISLQEWLSECEAMMSVVEEGEVVNWRFRKVRSQISRHKQMRHARHGVSGAAALAGASAGLPNVTKNGAGVDGASANFQATAREVLTPRAGC
eukprot:TRINITY_DN11848_c1_g4_i1.p1 TRINITY_DN11848_c1_g4~~TRINITY_DN11848_c1_g4_i1.p1  ORF type:complete len:266 (-),score=56.31 TRINITY_DN11848_c1_g4_i1:95-841(-)